MGIAKQVAMTAMCVPRTLPTGAQPLVIFNVLTMPSYSVGTMTPAAQWVATPSTTTIACRSAEIIYSRRGNSVTVTAQHPVKTRMHAP